ncbi:restriction endonuclease subunit S [Listeria monocytogenes]|uniref:restriction endonuclease subunit S n=1 Tax=Listeria TaxID=1637 RepID=UPI000AFF5366|nr:MULTISPECIES: restriction endonuclease subunit S [Listeria]MCD1672925.1 restriction endonuclease subunit S [Listeria monocytogenes]MCD1707456.1 restriction endonuclease subunit S [Listeria monocytogenes]MCD1716368.1 restriction endonuclease subunit S [Listeria monocytogenes]MCD1727921.1 restriction endonuclease subunit S [Listeria monocytogenes]MCD1841601.1 restriction endonuclease subunit S [Listeria monocytogenes]
MSHINKRVPKRRFMEFNNAVAWEQRKLGEIAKITMGQSPDGINYTDNPKYNILVQGNADMKNGQVVPRVWTKQITKTAKKGDIILSVRAPVGEVGKTKYNVVLGRGVSGVEGNEFVFQLLSKMKLENYWGKYSAGSTFESIKSNEIKAAIASVPEKQEQMKIGTFLKQLDDTIALHQRKLEKIKALKTAYLSEMFAAEGETKPKRRFAGFTDDWEQRKLCELAKITMGQSPEGVNYTDNPRDYVLVQGNADMQNGHVVPRVWTKQITKTAKKGDIILSVRAPVGDVGKTNYDVVLGRGVSALEGNEFIFQLLSKMKAENYWFKYSTGSTFESINSNEIKEAIVSAPEKQEQMKIGVFFKQLDKTITLHQRKLQKLQNIKKAYLNEMFI